MKTKSILVMVLAALMLFSFTACEQQMPTYKEVSYISLSQAKDILKGQTFTGDMVNITVHYTDGSSETVSGAGYATGTNADTGFDVTVSYAGIDDQKIKLYPVDPTSAVIEAVAESRKVTTARPDEDGAVELKSWTMTVTGGDNGSYTVNSADGKAVSNYSVAAAKIPAADKGTVGEYTVALSAAYGSTVIATDSTTKVTVYDDSIPPKAVAGVAPFYSVADGEDLNQAEFNATQLYIGQKVEVGFYTVDKDGEKVGTTALAVANASGSATPTDKAEIISNTFGNNTFSVASVAADTDVSATISYLYKDSEGKTTRYTATAKVGKGIDTVTDVVSVVVKGDLTAGAAISPSMFNVSIKSLVDTTGHIWGAEDKKDIDKNLSVDVQVQESTTVPASDATGATVHVDVTYDSYGKTYTETFTVTGIKAAAK